jgi:hypothetical protein
VPRQIDYVSLAAEYAVTAATWDSFVRAALVDRWMSEYEVATDWTTEVLEIVQGALTFLFDAAPTLLDDRTGGGDDRVVAVWGRSALPPRRRDRARLAGFLPNPLSWSGAARDRGHFVAHAADGGLDLNLFPQAVGLNRGRTEQGRRWREMERHAAVNPGTPLFVRPIYDGDDWTPVEVEHALLTNRGLRFERFSNR